jgi:hypothetical protein
VVDTKVEYVAQQQTATTQRLDQLYDEFTQFVAADLQQKQLQFAQTQIIEVRQMIEKEFGHYDEVRQWFAKRRCDKRRKIS